jgi:preprotein translocase subunit SecA
MREASLVAATLAAGLTRDVDYRVNVKFKEVDLLDPAGPKIDAAAKQLPQMWSGLARRRELVTQALVARDLFHRDAQYVVQDGKIVIVDESTGRLMPNRTWREGLHQAIEAKEGIAITAPTEILARLSFQKYFRLYRRLSGMTGTAHESAVELWQIYRLPVVAIPTNRPCVRVPLPDRCFAEAEAKWQAVVDEIAAVHAQGRPVLAGTRSVAASEDLARRLGVRGLSCHVLNAVRHAEEAEIVKHAGEAGRITIATNMAGRGTDILLGAGVAAAGGLHVIATEPNESGRVDRQLFGRAGRQGNPGSARRFVSMDDEIVRRFVPKFVRRRATGAGQADPRGLGGARAAAVYWNARYAQLAGSWLTARQRAAVLRHDTWLDEALSFSGPDAA